MSRDGYLPPDCTDRDVDMAAPGYWDDVHARTEREQVWEILERMEQDAGELCGKGYKADVMESVERIIKNCELDIFGRRTIE